MPPIACLLIVLVTVDAPKSKFPLGKDTTVVTGPLDKEGYIDYEAALDELMRKGISPESNANVLLWKAMGPKPRSEKRRTAEYFKRLGAPEPSEEGRYFVGLQPYLKDRLNLGGEKIDEITQQLDVARTRPWSAIEFPRIAAWLKVNEEPLSTVLQAVKRPNFYSPICPRGENPPSGMGDALPMAMPYREFATALSVRAMMNVESGKGDDAWNDVMACHRLGRLIAQGPFLIDALIGIAMDAMANRAGIVVAEKTQMSAKQFQARMSDLFELPPMPSIHGKTDVGERFFFLDGLQTYRREGLGKVAAEADDLLHRSKWTKDESLAGADWTSALKKGNQWVDRSVAASRKKERAEREHAFDEIAEDIKKMKAERGELKPLIEKLRTSKSVDSDGLVAIVDMAFTSAFPQHRNLQGAHDRSEQLFRNLQIALALAAYRSDAGRYPEKLTELAPKYLPLVPVDIFNDKPLVYQLSENGYLFYSVGRNGIDDKGRAVDDDPPGDDLPVRVPSSDGKNGKR